MNVADTTVALGYCHPGVVDGPFHESVVELFARPQRVIVGRHVVCSGPRIAAARNLVVAQFLEADHHAEWLWMVDTDMVFRPAILDQLLEAADPVRRPIVGALCFAGRAGGRVWPTLYRLRPPSEGGEPVEIIDDYPPDALCKVDATGAACLLIHRAALQRIHKRFGEPSAWFAESHHAGRDFGEDWTFCLRAAQCGLDIYVHTGAVVGHVKPMILGPEAHQAWLALDRELVSA